MTTSSAKRKIVTIGGGTGQFVLLSGLRDVEGVEITAVVSMTDSGGSTGRLRDKLGVLPPGDVLKCLLALSPHRDAVRQILLRRFESSEQLRGHNAGNMLLTMLSRYAGSFPDGIRAFSEIFDVHGTILPVSLERATLVATLSGGDRVYGETAIDLPRGDQREKITDVFLVPHHSDTIEVFPPVLEAIAEADHIVIGPGDLFTSIVANLIVPGVADALRKARARITYVLNIMTKFGETHNFSGHDFVSHLDDFLGRRVDSVLANGQKPDAATVARYREQKSEFVTVDPTNPEWQSTTVHVEDMLGTSGGIVRHDSKRLAEEVIRIVSAPGAAGR